MSQEAQRNFTSNTRTSAGKTGAQRVSPPVRPTGLGTGMDREQAGHSTIFFGDSAGAVSSVPQMTQKKWIVGIRVRPEESEEYARRA